MIVTDPLNVHDALSDELLRECEDVLDHRFRDRQLLYAALTHASGADSRLASNERLEFLGDAVLGLVVCDWLYQQYPDALEGELTRIKSIVVSRLTCARISRRLDLKRFLLVGKGLAGDSSVPSSVLADVFEALIAAMYLDAGLEPARRFIIRELDEDVRRAAAEAISGNFKSHLQQVAQKRFGHTPTYELLDEKGPDHSKCFKILARVGPRRYTPAWGRNKKDAEQRAALNALSEIQGDPIPYAAD